MAKQLSEHDKKLIEEIETIRREWGWVRWPDIAALAQELEDEDERKAWENTCKNYSLYERGRSGDL